MTRDELTALARGLAPIVSEHITKAYGVLSGRMDVLEQRMEAVKDGAPGERGEKGDSIVGPVGLKGDPGEPGLSVVGPQGEKGDAGKDVDVSLVLDLQAEMSRVRAEVAESRAAVPTLEQFTSVIHASVAAAVAEIPPARDGQDGKSIDPVEFEEMLSARVATAVSALPVPEDGIDGRDASPEMVEAAVSKAIAALPLPKDGRDGLDGKDGIGLAGMLIDRDGHLVGTLSDGSTRPMGLVVGKDGAPGQPGRDGFGFEDFEEEFDGERTLVRRYRRGDEVKEFRHTFPIVIDRGVYQPGRTYEKGDGVTWAGSFWIAQEATSAKPGEPGSQSRAWRLAVKKGTDGKTGPAGPLGPQGMKGDVGPMGPARY